MRWAGVSDGNMAFASRADAGKAFNYVGASQNDSDSGDIRIAAHKFDGAGKVLAHAYFPPPNGSTAAGDAHFDNAEKWVDQSGNPLSTGSVSSGTASGGFSGSLVFSEMAGGAEGMISSIAVQSEASQPTAATGTEESTEDRRLGFDTVEERASAVFVSSSGQAASLWASESSSLLAKRRRDAADRLFNESDVLDLSLDARLATLPDTLRSSRPWRA